MGNRTMSLKNSKTLRVLSVYLFRLLQTGKKSGLSWSWLLHSMILKIATQMLTN